MQPHSPDLEACEALIRAGSKSFFLASKVLPDRVRQPALALYAFCRVADDLIDAGCGEHRLVALRERLERIYAGAPADSAADRAFADVVALFSIPRAYPESLLEGFEWDLEVRRYAGLEEVIEYAVRVAGSVGMMMACIMGARSPEAIGRACDLGVAMQLTNIARDVGEDARAGRLYLPTDWLREEGIDPLEWLTCPTFSPELGIVVSRLLSAADRLYERADAGIALLPRDCRFGIHAARAVYREIGHHLMRKGGDSVSHRTVVPAGRKAVTLLRAYVSSGPCDIDGRIEWLCNLFERLEQRDRNQVST